jgi:hypothetical protein
MLTPAQAWRRRAPVLDWTDGTCRDRRESSRDEEHLDRYYDEVISQLGPLEGLLILGPGEAKLQLDARLTGCRALPGDAIDVEPADKLTDPQTVARVKAHYGLDHPRA